MKTRLIAVCAVLLATVLCVFLLTVSPGRPSPPAPPSPPPAPAPAAPPPAAEPAAKTPPSAALPPAPLPSEQELAAMEERIAASVERLPVLDRMKLAFLGPRPKMLGEDYEKARALYLRFLDNFEGIKSGRFRVETYRLKEDGSEYLSSTEEIVWEGDKHRIERTLHDDRVPKTYVEVINGKRGRAWDQGKVAWEGKVRRSTWCPRYLHGGEMATVSDRHPWFLNSYTNVELDDGSRGYSRLWNAEGNEARFDTATGLRTFLRHGDGFEYTSTYQSVNGRWFPQEEVQRHKDPDPLGCGRRVFSQVVLDEPMDAALFDLSRKKIP